MKQPIINPSGPIGKDAIEAVPKPRTPSQITLTLSSALSIADLRSLIDPSGCIQARITVPTLLLSRTSQGKAAASDGQVLHSLISFKITGSANGLSNISWSIIDPGQCTSSIQVRAIVRFEILQGANSAVGQDLVMDTVENPLA